MSVLDQLPKASLYRMSHGGGHPLSQFSGRIQKQGRFFVNAGGIFRPRFTSALTLLAKPRDQRDAFIQWAINTGFNGLRVFAGHLAWAGQTPESARANLPDVLDVCRAAGLYVEVTAITDSGVGYDFRDHLLQVVGICNQYENTILEVANEPWHPTQAEKVQDLTYLNWLKQSTVPSSLLTALGAPSTDEPAEGTPVGDYLTLHLDRGRDMWNQGRRLREMEMASGTFRVPVMNNEPIGADELDGSQTGKQRINRPEFFFMLGVLSRVFEVGSVHHSQHGLLAELPGPVQQACAEAFIRGFTVIPVNCPPVHFKNAGWADSPVRKASFSNVVRVYSGLCEDGVTNISVPLGITGPTEIEWQNGWHPTAVLAEMNGIQVLKIER